MLYTSDKTYSKSSKFGLYRYDQYEEENKEEKSIIRTIFVAASIIFILLITVASLYYLPLEDDTQLLSPIKENNLTSNGTIRKLSQHNLLQIENATALPFFSSLFSNYMEQDSRQLNRKIINNEKQSQYDASKIDKYPYQNEKRGKHIQDLLAYYEEQRLNDESLDYRGLKFKGLYRHPENDIYGSVPSGYGYKNSLAYERVPPDPFHRYKPQSPGDVNMLAPNTYRFSPHLYKKPDKQIKPVSVMLDIYPMSQDGGVLDKTSIIGLLTKPILQATIPINQKLSKVPETTPYPYENVIVTTEAKVDKNNKEPQTPNNMVVHLNLYPRKRQRHHKKKLANRHSLFKINPGYIMADTKLIRNRHKNTYEYGDHIINEEYQDYDNDYDEYYDLLPGANRKHHRDRKIDTEVIEYGRPNINTHPVDDLNLENTELREIKLGRRKSFRHASHLNRSSKQHNRSSNPHSTSQVFGERIHDIGVRNSSELDSMVHQIPKINFIQSPPQIQRKMEYVAVPISEEVLVEHIKKIGVNNSSEVVQKKQGMTISIIPPQILHNKYLTTPSTSLHWDLNQLKPAGGKLPNHRSENTF